MPWTKTHKISLYFPSNHQICQKTQNRTKITKIHGPFTGFHWIMCQSFRAISLKCDCLILHPACVWPQHYPWTNTQYDNTHINKAQMERRKKQMRARAGPDLAQEEWHKVINIIKCHQQFPDNPSNNLPATAQLSVNIKNIVKP